MWKVDTHKYCRKCKQWKPYDCFRYKSGTKRESHCKQCRNRALSLRRKKNKYHLGRDRTKRTKNPFFNIAKHGGVSAKELFIAVGNPDTCYLCGKKIISRKEAHIDHVIPRSKGGTNLPDNLKWCHAICNQVKFDLTIPELMVLFKDILNHLVSTD